MFLIGLSGADRVGVPCTCPESCPGLALVPTGVPIGLFVSKLGAASVTAVPDPKAEAVPADGVAVVGPTEGDVSTGVAVASTRIMLFSAR